MRNPEVVKGTMQTYINLLLVPLTKDVSDWDFLLSFSLAWCKSYLYYIDVAESIFGFSCGSRRFQGLWDLMEAEFGHLLKTLTFSSLACMAWFGRWFSWATRSAFSQRITWATSVCWRWNTVHTASGLIQCCLWKFQRRERFTTGSRLLKSVRSTWPVYLDSSILQDILLQSWCSPSCIPLSEQTGSCQFTAHFHSSYMFEPGGLKVWPSLLNAYCLVSSGGQPVPIDSATDPVCLACISWIGSDLPKAVSPVHFVDLKTHHVFLILVVLSACPTDL